MAISDDLENIKQMTVSEKIAEAQAMIHYLMIELQAVGSNSADGVSISRNISDLREYIKDLKQERAETAGDVKGIIQMRIDR